jgi:fimbrial chaperone protein
MQLTPTEDIAFFPALLTLNAGEERKVRVATTLTAAGTEKTYRIFFEELPPLERPESSGAQVRILTKMGIPIFLAPEKASEDASIESVQMQKGTLTFDVRNGGNVHFALDGVKVRGLGSNGEVLFERQVEGWYVLAGSLRSYSIDVPADSCSKLKKITIEATTDIQSKATITKDFEVTPALCK